MRTSFINNFQRDAFGDLAGSSLVRTGADAVLPGSGAILGILTGLFGSKPNPNDWKGWDAQDSQNNRPPGTSVAWWVITDGDSVQNEALNAISYMRTKTQGVQKVYDAALEVYQLNTAQFTAKLVDKLKRAGYPTEAAQFGTMVGNLTKATTSNQTAAYQNGTMQTAAPTKDNLASNAQNGDASADTNKKTWLIVGIIGGVIVIAGVIIAVVKMTGKGK